MPGGRPIRCRLARVPWPAGHRPDLAPFDVVEAVLADEPERDDLAQPEAVSARGLPRGSSLARLLAKHRGVRNCQDLPKLRPAQVIALHGWMRNHADFDVVLSGLDAVAPDLPGFSVFFKDAGADIFHTYSTYARGLDPMNVAYQLLDLVPKGRDETGLAHSMAWLKLHDQYAT